MDYMIIENNIHEIKRKCDEILSFSMWFNLSESAFWPIIELMDIDEDFLINIYSSIEDKHLEILCHEPVIVAVIESLQSKKLIDYIISIRYEKPDLIDDILIRDIESALFVNFDETVDILDVQKFKDTYMALKEFTKETLNKDQNNDEIINTLDSIIDFSEKNRHEYLSYIRVYWLNLYFQKASLKLKNQDLIKYYSKVLSGLFPFGCF
ncbi:hypothetical protein Xhom_04740 [Xenorhabdus hominickii]|uniref:Uncharacterized protein n=2 Tax=Xenorhabdus hominickii TaxID=351679 RepID=A0A2G0PY52_XENHO|nr:hypothetical protein Xhom_04740 [Xenorhabdus hominickii]